MTGPVQPGEPDREPTALPDRGISPVGGRLGGRRGRMITAAALVAGCGVFLAATWDRGPDPDRTGNPGGDRIDGPPRQLAPFEPAHREPPLLADGDMDPDAPRLTDGPSVPALTPEDDVAAAAAGPSPAEQRRLLADSARRAPVMVFSGPAPGSGSGSRPSAPPPSPMAATPPGGEPTALDRLRATGPIEVAAAGRTADRDLLLSAGASLPCILQTALDSTTPGLVACVLPQDVYSDAGSVVLLERGTRVLGEYRGGLQQGRRRLFVLWTRAVTPTGVSIALASPAADALGRAGFGGDVDSRFWDRFGGALLLSLVDDAAHAAAGAREEGRGAVRLPSDAATAALQGSIDIPPTLSAAQGSEVSIFTARDLDFRPVYGLRARP